MSDTCNMVLVEVITDKFQYFWECSECKLEHKATKKFEKNTKCPACGKQISHWIGMEGESQDD